MYASLFAAFPNFLPVVVQKHMVKELFLVLAPPLFAFALDDPPLPPFPPPALPPPFVPLEHGLDPVPELVLVLLGDDPSHIVARILVLQIQVDHPHVVRLELLGEHLFELEQFVVELGEVGQLGHLLLGDVARPDVLVLLL